MVNFAFFNADALSAQKDLYEKELAKLKEQLESSNTQPSTQSPQPPKLTTYVNKQTNKQHQVNNNNKQYKFKKKNSVQHRINNKQYSYMHIIYTKLLFSFCNSSMENNTKKKLFLFNYFTIM